MALLELWGCKKLENGNEHVPDVSADIEISMNKSFLRELEEPENETIEMEKITVPPLSAAMLHAVALHQHATDIWEMIRLQKLTKTMEKVEFKMPQYKEIDANSVTKLNFIKEDFQNFTEENEAEVCTLSKTVVRQISAKCIATMFTQVGYETSQQSALDVLTDVLQDFLRKISHHVKIAVEDEETHNLGFPNVIERVLVEMGLGGVRALDDYYHSRVIKYVSVLENRCQHLSEKYQALLIPKPPSPIHKINKVVRVKVEEEDVVEVENPEVHFSTIDGDVNFSILETGYQLLNSLEAEANLQSMTDNVEDIAVTESPGVVSMSSDDMPHLSPYSKKKRFK